MDAGAAGGDPAAAPAASPWSLGSRTSWTAHEAGWIAFAVLWPISRLFLFADATLAASLTLLLDPLDFVLTAAAHVLYLSRTRHRQAVVIATTMAGPVAGGVLPMQAAGAVKTLVFHELAANEPETFAVELSNPERLTPQGVGRAGLGLVNAGRRLELLYPQRHGLRLIESAGQVTARLRLEDRPCVA